MANLSEFVQAKSEQVNLYNPTNAEAMKSEFDLAHEWLLGLRTLSVEESSTYIKLNSQMPCPPRGAGPG